MLIELKFIAERQACMQNKADESASTFTVKWLDEPKRFYRQIHNHDSE